MSYLFRHRTAGALGIAVGIAMVMTGCDGGSSQPASIPSSEVMTLTSVDKLVAGVPHESVAPPPVMHLADGVVPPTNRWYSALAFNDEMNPVFASPLSFAPTDGGFTFGLPRVSASADLIVGPANLEVAVAVGGSTGRPVVSSADPVAVGLDYRDGAGSPVATASLAAGWPVIGVTADAATTLTLPGEFAQGEATPVDGQATTVATATIGGIDYGVVTSGSFAGSALDLAESDTAQFFAVPEGSDAATFASALGAPIGEVPVGVSVTDDSTTTRLTYAPKGETTVVAVPQHRAMDMDCDLGTYSTINGELAVCAAGEVAWDVPTVAPSIALDLSGITDSQREAITGALVEDVAATGTLPADTYFGGKALYRVAMLVELADAMDEPELKASLMETLSSSLRSWTVPEGCETRPDRCFVYDEAMRGMVGKEASFGADQFNDHHFHYGYFLNAAAVAATFDPDLVPELSPVMDLLAADLASGEGLNTFPELRTFDPYAGHAWASGTSPFIDGNNQESSSEAVVAWNGLASWAKVRGDDALGTTAQWMLSSEASTALSNWVRPDLADFPEYSHPIVALEWGGKREYSTWFSSEPAAMLGIQLIPMAPMAGYLAPQDDAEADVARASLDEAAAGGFEVGFGDFMLMYKAMLGEEDRAAAWDSAVDLPTEFIDDGNSRAYMLAWIAAADG
jgi:endo-1,3(4)-beta-glucanase